MSDFVAVDKIVKILEAAIKMFPNGVRVPGKISRDFDEIVNPAYEQVGEFHVDYISLFKKTRDDIISGISKSRIMQIENSGEKHFSDSQFKEFQSEIVAVVKQGRDKYDLKRDVFRTKALAYISVTDVKEMQRFLCAVIDYFVYDEDRGFYKSDDQFDGLIEDLKNPNRGGNSVYPSRATFTSFELSKCKDGKEMLNFVEKVLNNTQVRYYNVVYTFEMAKRACRII